MEETWVLDLARQRVATVGAPQLFGVIVYTDRHVHIKKLLRDDDYWAALNELSGPTWTVFSVRAHAGRWVTPSAPRGSFATMQRVWKEPAANRELILAFELKDTKDLPALVLFAFDGDALHRASARIEDGTLESSYASLKQVFVEVTAALNRLSPSEVGDPVAAFGSVKGSLRSLRNWQRVREAYRVIKELRDWLPF